MRGVALIFPVIAAGYYFNNNVAVEGELLIAPTLGYLLLGNITYNWREPERRVNPFVLVGVGVGISAVEPGTQDIIMNLCSGIKIRVTDWFYFRAELRYPIYLVY